MHALPAQPCSPHPSPRRSDLASIFVQLFEDDALAFACFERLMRSARRNFRHDETGIRWGGQGVLPTRVMDVGGWLPLPFWPKLSTSSPTYTTSPRLLPARFAPQASAAADCAGAARHRPLALCQAAAAGRRGLHVCLPVCDGRVLV